MLHENLKSLNQKGEKTLTVGDFICPLLHSLSHEDDGTSSKY